MIKNKSKKSINFKYGLIAENIAAEFLENKGYKVLCRRYKKFGIGEIDLILFNNIKKEFLIVEVKGRKSLNLSKNPHEITNKFSNFIESDKYNNIIHNIIRYSQLKKIYQCAEIFISELKEFIDKLYNGKNLYNDP
ncbi:YraN family protein [Lyticum sinuosum]|uniref:YraN family protein n=1 Tax=Lyticum sinuosum TaxID=1332059 RepID=A0AAE4VLV4_9RICK|nr:YraN family protein [Lyticum sinuosum]MDZ5761038.1 YraN family protein [Lyticum sinuosum]